MRQLEAFSLELGMKEWEQLSIQLFYRYGIQPDRNDSRV